MGCGSKGTINISLFAPDLAVSCAYAHFAIARLVSSTVYLHGDSILLAEEVDICVLTAAIDPQHMDKIRQSKRVPKNEEIFELLDRCVLRAHEEYSAVVRVVVDEFNEVTATSMFSVSLDPSDTSKFRHRLYQSANTNCSLSEAGFCVSASPPFKRRKACACCLLLVTRVPEAGSRAIFRRCPTLNDQDANGRAAVYLLVHRFTRRG